MGDPKRGSDPLQPFIVRVHLRVELGGASIRSPAFARLTTATIAIDRKSPHRIGDRRRARPALLVSDDEDRIFGGARERNRAAAGGELITERVRALIDVPGVARDAAGAAEGGVLTCMTADARAPVRLQNFRTVSPLTAALAGTGLLLASAPEPPQRLRPFG